MKMWILRAAVTCCTVMVITISVSALDITLTYDPSAPEAATAAFDTSGALLTDLMEAAAIYWEDVIEDSHTIDVTFFYKNFTADPEKLGDTLVQGNDGVKPTVCRIRIDSTPIQDWYQDSTPFDHSEYNMSQTTVGDLSSGNRSAWYNDFPPDLLEASYMGGDASGAPDSSDIDMFTVILHEFGHALGMASPTAAGWSIDGDYDFNSDQVWGATVAAETYSTVRPYHLASELALMSREGGAGQRVMPSATDVLAIAAAVGWSDIDLPRKDFLDTGDGEWNTALNWSGGQTPDDEDEVKVRHGGDVELVNDGEVGTLEIHEGNSVFTGAHRLTVYQRAIVGPAGLTESRLSANNASGECILLSGLEIGRGGIAEADEGTISVSGTVTNEGVIRADGGTISVGGTITNEGVIQAVGGGLFEASVGLDSAGNISVNSMGDLRTGTGYGLTMQPLTTLAIEDSGSTVDISTGMVQDGWLNIKNHGQLVVGNSIDAGLNDWSQADLQDAEVEVGGQWRLGINHNAQLKTARSDIVVGSLMSVGHDLTSTLDMRGGTLTTRYLYLGYNVGSSGTMIMSTDSGFQPWVGFTDSSEAFEVGYAGTGIVTQLSGMVTRANTDVAYPNLAVAGGEGGKGTYDLHDGTIRLTDFRLGQGGEGTFTQTGGDVTVHNELIFGQQLAGMGVYDLQDGTLSVLEISNGAGSGQLNVDGGVLTLTGPSAEVKELNIGLRAGSSGDLSLTGKTLTVNKLRVAVDGLGKLSLDGCTTNVSSELVVGDSDRGEMTQTGGSVTTSVLRVGYHGLSQGQYMINGGTLTTTSFVQLGGAGQGTISQTSGASVEVGTDVWIGAAAGSRGQWNVGDGHLLVNGDIAVGLVDDGAMTLGGGTVEVPTGVLSVYSAGSFSGYGLLDAEMANGGSLRASAVELVINKDYSGSGTITVDPGAQLVFRGPASLGGATANDGTLIVESNVTRLDGGMTTSAIDAEVHVEPSATLEVYSDMSTANMVVGGDVDHPAGSVVLSDALDLDGEYLLDGTGQLACVTARIDNKFEQNAGNFQPDAMYVGQLGGMAKYVIQAGELHAGDVHVGVSHDDGDQPGVFAILDPGAYVEVSGELFVSSQGQIDAAAGSVIHLTGSPFVNHSYTPGSLEDLTRTTLIFEGGDLVVDPFEVAGKDLGASPDGLKMNFAVGTLQIGGAQPGHLRLVDAFTNQLRWPGGEALYVHDLIIGPGASLDLDGQLLYYDNLTNLGGTVFENGGQLTKIPEPTTLILLAMGGVALLRRKRKL
ncbi:MAG: PEP-CTERM sorting domain-containing protein [Phycisphaerae bacterium]|jgi:hypothetical protein|nr:PEP-CTERM sorting domain-containing protein [Phycisphaerae bacterium]